MTSAERLKEIEKLQKERKGHVYYDEMQWLIARMNRLTEALENIAGASINLKPITLKRLAKQALEEE